jgi:hypothetical protein
MPFGLDDALLIASALSGGYEAFFGGGMSKKDREDLAYWENRSKNGLSTPERSNMTQIYAPTIARGVYAKQDRLSRMSASTGASDSSYARRAIMDIPSVGETLTPILAEADMNARNQAAGMYHGMKSGFDERRQNSINSGLTALGETAGAAVMKYGRRKADLLSTSKATTQNAFGLDQDAMLSGQTVGVQGQLDENGIMRPRVKPYSRLRVGGGVGLPFQYGDWNLNDQWPYNYSWEK